jgi:hypothetical protein
MLKLIFALQNFLFARLKKINPTIDISLSNTFDKEHITG